MSWNGILHEIRMRKFGYEDWHESPVHGND